jgi:hypothetical protein
LIARRLDVKHHCMEDRDKWAVFKQTWGPTMTGLHVPAAQYQTMCGVKGGSTNKKHATLLNFIFESIAASDEFETEGGSSEPWASIQQMLDCERAAFAMDYFVFYRLIGKKYILYEFNTIMLSLLTEKPLAAESVRLIPVPSLSENDYPESIESAIEMFRGNDGVSDSSPEISSFLLSVNNTLKPTKNTRAKNHTHVTIEAQPLSYFFDGYDETHGYMEKISSFLQAFLGASAQEAEQIIADLVSAYDEAQSPHEHNGGHTLQICVPRAALERFVYPAVAWGHPVSVWHDAGKRLQVVPVWQHQLCNSDLRKNASGMKGGERVRVPADWTAIPFEAFLHSPDVGHLQSRIMAHPFLFLEHGAVTNVFHGNVHFNAPHFRVRAVLRLRPLIERALAERKSLRGGPRAVLT